MKGVHDGVVAVGQTWSGDGVEFTDEAVGALMELGDKFSVGYYDMVCACLSFGRGGGGLRTMSIVHENEASGIGNIAIIHALPIAAKSLPFDVGLLRVVVYE